MTFFVNKLVKLWNMLPDEVVLFSSLRDTWMSLCVTGIYIIITKPTHTTGSHNVILLYLSSKCTTVIGSNRITWCKLIWGIDQFTGQYVSSYWPIYTLTGQNQSEWSF